MTEPISAPSSDSRNIFELVNNWATATPDAIAIAAPGQAPISYQQLAKLMVAVVEHLNRIGIGRGDRVAVSLANGPEMALAFLTIASGATVAPLNPNYREQEYRFYLQDLEAKALVVADADASPAAAVAREFGIPILTLVGEAETLAGPFRLEGGTVGTAAVAGLAAAADVALVLHTSGTTSRPKQVPLSGHNLCLSAGHVAAALQLTESDRCLNVMPLFHIHGLVGVLLSSLRAGGSVVCMPGFEVGQFFAGLDEFQPTWFSAVPTIHQVVLAQAQDYRETVDRARIRFIRASSAPLPPPVMAGLEKMFGAPAIESYGMTEAAHQMTSNPLPPAVRKPGSVGIAAGPEVTILDESGRELPVEETGEVAIRGENVTSGYYNNPAANDKAFTNGWFRTGDLGYLDGDRYLFLKGRIKEMINRGGEKIAPREIDEALLAHPAVVQAVAFAVPHPVLGEDVAAAVVLDRDRTVTAAALRAYLFEQLADFKVPSQVVLVADIPKGATGKVQRIGLAEKLAAALTAEAVAPRNPLEEVVMVAIRDVLGVETIGVCDNFFTIGGDSLRGMQVVNRLNALFGVSLPHTILFRQPTVAELTVAIADVTGNAEDLAEIADVLLELAVLPAGAISQLIEEL